jgi:two-component sensor histidine kinase
MQYGETLMVGDRQPGAKPIDRSLLYVMEFLHRVQNEYTKAISFASVIARRSSNPEAKAALSQMIEHLLASANAHNLLLPRVAEDCNDFTADVTRLCHTMASADLDQRGIQLHLTISEPIMLDGLRCWRANLILSELITNAARHAFDSLAGGCIAVDVALTGGRVVCTVSDSGNAVRPPNPGLGTRLVDALAEDLAGEVKRCFTENGTIITLSFPTDPESKQHLDS